MVRFIALYQRPADTAAFDAYFNGTHLPLTRKIPEVTELRVSKPFGSPTGKTGWYLMVELAFKDKDSFKRGIMSPESMAAGKDTDNFAKDLVERFFVDDAPAPVAR